MPKKWKLIKSCTPRRLWSDCLELESYIRSNTAHINYKLDGEVPETIMSGEMSNISQFCEFEWFEWVMFQDKIEAYPMITSGWVDRYLGLSIDMGHSLMENIIKKNGQILYRSTYQALTIMSGNGKSASMNVACS